MDTFQALMRPRVYFNPFTTIVVPFHAYFYSLHWNISTWTRHLHAQPLSISTWPSSLCLYCYAIPIFTFTTTVISNPHHLPHFVSFQHYIFPNLAPMMKFSSFVVVMCCIALLTGCFAEQALFKKNILEVYESSYPEDNILPTFMFSQGMLNLST